MLDCPKIKFICFLFLLYLFCISSVPSSGLTLGLVSKNGEGPLDLLDLRTKAIVEGPYAEIEYVHVYKNPYDKPLETEFYFPRTENSVFYKFEAIFRNEVIVGKIMEKEQAKEMYQWNLERGNTVAYSERNAETPDVMKVQVGNIPAYESVEIRFSVIQPLEIIINQFWSFTLPSVLTERYSPSSVDPSKVAQITNVDLEQSSYRDWKIEVEIRSDKPFSYMRNPTHNIPATLSADSNIYKAVWDITIIPNKNFVVYFRSDKIFEPSTILASHPSYSNDQVLLVNFLPNLNKLDTIQAQKTLDEEGEEGFLKLRDLALREDSENAKGEFIFVIDRSGSMYDQRIKNLKKALEKFLNILPKDSYFNILSFGSSFSFYKPESIKYDSKSLSEALKWISSIDADMGGTEILPALQEATRIPLMKGYPRTMMVLTDGAVSNPSEVISHVRNSADKARVCSVGIGYGASEFLVKNIAKAGKCTSQFVLDNEDIGDKAIYMIKAATSQYIEKIDFNIDCFDSKNKRVFTEASKMGMLLKDEPFKKWVYLKEIAEIQYCNAKISYFNSLKDATVTEEFKIEGFSNAERTETWHKVAYDAKIKDLDIELKSEGSNPSEELKNTIIQLSIKYQILTDYTSFLAVIQESTVDPNEEKIQEKISNLDSADYSSSKSSQESAGSPPKMHKAPAPADYMNYYQSPSASGGYSASSLKVSTSMAAMIFLCWIVYLFIDIFDGNNKNRNHRK